MIVTCSKAGSVVISKKTNIIAMCKDCSGKIEIDNGSVTLSTKVDGFRPLPRKPDFEFNCPATISNPKSSELVS